SLIYIGYYLLYLVFFGILQFVFFFFSSRRRHTRSTRDWSSDVCSSDLADPHGRPGLLDRDRSDRHVLKPVEAPLERGRLPRPERSEERRVGKECRSRGATEH